ncbi:MAG: hypothetical protein ACOC90_02745, partial [Bacteroidota bacterium]
MTKNKFSRSFPWPTILCGLFLFLTTSFSKAQKDKPNVLLINIDDLNDWVNHLDGHPKVQT